MRPQFTALCLTLLVLSAGAEETVVSPTARLICGLESKSINRRPAVLALLKQLKIDLVDGQALLAKALVVKPQATGSFLNEKAFQLVQKYGAVLQVDVESCGSASASRDDVTRPRITLTALDLAMYADGLTSLYSTLVHEESHIANSDPRFGISPQSPFLWTITSQRALSLPPYTSSFSVDEISSYIAELTWSFSAQAVSLNGVDLLRGRQQPWMMLRSLSQAFCGVIKQYDVDEKFLGFNQVLPVEGLILSTTSLNKIGQDSKILIIGNTVQQSDTTLTSLSLNANGTQLIMPLFSHKSLDQPKVRQDSLAMGGLTQDLQAITENTRGTLRRGHDLCLMLEPLLNTVPEKIMNAGIMKLSIISGQEPELRRIIPMLVEIRRKAIK